MDIVKILSAALPAIVGGLPGEYGVEFRTVADDRALESMLRNCTKALSFVALSEATATQADLASSKLHTSARVFIAMGDPERSNEWRAERGEALQSVFEALLKGLSEMSGDLAGQGLTLPRLVTLRPVPAPPLREYVCSCFDLCVETEAEIGGGDYWDNSASSANGGGDGSGFEVPAGYEVFLAKTK